MDEARAEVNTGYSKTVSPFFLMLPFCFSVGLEEQRVIFGSSVFWLILM